MFVVSHTRTHTPDEYVTNVPNKMRASFHMPLVLCTQEIWPKEQGSR